MRASGRLQRLLRVFRGLRARFRHTLLRRRLDREMDDEIAFHLAMEAEKLESQGVDPAEARRRAAVAFGGVERHREALREGRRVPVLEPLVRDVRFGMRSLAREPGLTLAAVVTIALGVGATTAVFSVTRALLLRPLPIPEVDRLMSIQEQRSGAVSTGVEGMLIPYPRFEAYADATEGVFRSTAAVRLDGFALRLDDVTVHVDGALTSGGFFETVGIRPILGRVYTGDDDAEIVISHDLWLARFGGDPEVVGRRVALDGAAVTIVGVGPRGFRGVTAFADALWAPVGIRDLEPDSWGLRVVPLGRLADGVDRARAAAVVDAAAGAIPSDPNATIRGATLDPVQSVPVQGRGVVGAFLGLLLGLAVLVLLIAAANIASVLLARAFARRRETAVRLALGAGRARVVRHLLAEALLLFVAGGAAGVALAYLGTAALASIPLPPQAPVILDLAPDRTVLVFALAVTGGTGLVFGLVPALQASRPGLIGALRAGGWGATAGGGWTRDLFVGGQVALSVLLLATAALFAGSFRAGASVDPGFDAAGVVVARIDLGAPHDYDGGARLRFWSELRDRARAIPGVKSVGLAQLVLLSGDRWGGDVRAADDPDAPGVNAFSDFVGWGWFEALEVEIVEGRAFRPSDGPDAPPVAVVNQFAAERLWPGETAVGRRLRGAMNRSEEVEVVGVVRDGRYVFATEEPTAAVFQPLDQMSPTAASIHLRAPGSEARALRELGEIVRSMDADVALELAGPLEALIGFSLYPHRIAAGLVGAFGVVGLLLSALGLHGVLAHQVARRTREFGVRRALGAGTGDVVARVLGRGAVLAGAGCAVGLAAGWLVARGVGSFLYGVTPLGAPSLAAVAALLFAVAVGAGLVPALRAGRVAPARALRDE